MQPYKNTNSYFGFFLSDGNIKPEVKTAKFGQTVPNTNGIHPSKKSALHKCTNQQSTRSIQAKPTQATN